MIKSLFSATNRPYKPSLYCDLAIRFSAWIKQVSFYRTLLPRSRNKGLTFLFFFSCFSSLATAATTELTNEYLLPNGLKLIVQEDHRAPVAVFQIWYKVGSVDEYSGITGLSHMLEHLMFKGSKRYPGDAFSAIIAKNGGNQNAGTSADYTVYYQEMEASRIEVSFELEADRMKNLTLTKADFLPERDVVAEERRWRVEDNPNAMLYERFKAAAYLSSGYHHPVIGWMEDIKSYNLDDVNAWYQRWYAPNNAVIVVVGDVDPQQMLAMANKHFGKIRPTHIPKRKPRTEPPSLGEKRIELHITAKLPSLLLGYRAPVFNTANNPRDLYALYVLASALSSGNSSRFAKKLVRGQEVAVAANAYYNPAEKMQTQFLISAVPATGHTVQQLEESIDAEIEKIMTTPLAEEELARIKTAVIAADVYHRDSLAAQGYLLGGLEVTGVGWQKDKQFVENIQQVTGEEIQRAAKNYLLKSNRTVAILYPTTEKNDQ